MLDNILALALGLGIGVIVLWAIRSIYRLIHTHGYAEGRARGYAAGQRSIRIRVEDINGNAYIDVTAEYFLLTRLSNGEGFTLMVDAPLRIRVTESK